ncbi:ChbG/HpnK family deacetylase [Delftia sp. PS-11]|uniref:ChbG/HpnK family deacetylase n=1 Tax=Delftia sp. PS-11 TaxID=2767222 RepID=UPI0024589ED5|nr:ChbG/HpnK family deacetylase [Delftia sp. PS-11]KAJ8746189.1 ChbG/HpnK family deacetylase [Delftia sp. PS-11]
MNISPATGLAKTVVLCADDYALHPLVDEAVEHLALQGRLSATSCMVTSPRWKQAASRLPALRPRLSLGLHFNLTEGHGIGPGAGIGAVIVRAYAGRLGQAALRDAWRRQLDAFEDALGMAPDFIDGHQHVHQLPGVRAALMQELERRYGTQAQALPWVRSTAPAGQLWRDPKAVIIALLGGWTITRRLRRQGVPHNHGFGGVYGFDAPSPEGYGRHMAQWLAQLGPGSLMMCHPAVAPVEGDAIGAQRAVEYAYLRSSAFALALAQSGALVAQGPLTPLFAAG